MTAYLIVNYDVDNPELYGEYQQGAVGALQVGSASKLVVLDPDRETGEVSSRGNRWGGGFRPTLSPDGRWLVYGSRHIADTGLRIRDLESGEERWLAWPVQRDDHRFESLAIYGDPIAQFLERNFRRHPMHPHAILS